MRITPEEFEDFKAYMADKLTQETGNLYTSNDIYICEKIHLGLLFD